MLIFAVVVGCVCAFVVLRVIAFMADWEYIRAIGSMTWMVFWRSLLPWWIYQVTGPLVDQMGGDGHIFAPYVRSLYVPALVSLGLACCVAGVLGYRWMPWWLVRLLARKPAVVRLPRPTPVGRLLSAFSRPRASTWRWPRRRAQTPLVVSPTVPPAVPAPSVPVGPPAPEAHRFSKVTETGAPTASPPLRPLDPVRLQDVGSCRRACDVHHAARGVHASHRSGIPAQDTAAPVCGCCRCCCSHRPEDPRDSWRRAACQARR